MLRPCAHLAAFAHSNAHRKAVDLAAFVNAGEREFTAARDTLPRSLRYTHTDVAVRRSHQDL